MTIQENMFVEESSGNVFADLGFPDAETHQLKAQLVDRVREAMHDRHMTQVAAAKQVGTNQPEMSRILRGQFRSVSVERLMQMLTKLGCEVDIVVRPQGRPTSPSVIHFGEAMPA